jgi:hypothetical protein
MQKLLHIRMRKLEEQIKLNYDEDKLDLSLINFKDNLIIYKGVPIYISDEILLENIKKQKNKI